MSNAIKIRVNIAGFAGSAISMFCAYDPATDVLLVARVASDDQGREKYEAGPRDGFLKVTNVPSDMAFDAIFSSDQTKEAIEA